MRVNFYNTFEIAVPIWNWLFPYLTDKENIQPKGIISSSKYRISDETKLDISVEKVHVPAFLGDSKASAHLVYAIVVPFKLLFDRPALNVFFTQPPFLLPVLCAFSRIARTPYIVHIMDYHPDMLVQKRSNTFMRVLQKSLDFTYKQALNHAESVVVLGSCMRELIIEKGVEQSKIIIIPNISSVEKDALEMQGKSDSTSLEQNRDILRIVYSGNQGRAHEFKTILSVAEQLKGKVSFEFIGGGYRNKQIREAVIANSLTNVILRDYLSEKEFIRVVQSADAHFISLSEGYTGVMVPSKFYTSLEAGKLVIFEGSLRSEVARALLEHNCGYHIPYKDSIRLGEVILEIYEDRMKASKMGIKSREIYYENYSSKIFCKKYSEIINKSVNSAL